MRAVSSCSAEGRDAGGVDDRAVSGAGGGVDAAFGGGVDATFFGGGDDLGFAVAGAASGVDPSEGRASLRGPSSPATVLFRFFDEPCCFTVFGSTEGGGGAGAGCATAGIPSTVRRAISSLGRLGRVTSTGISCFPVAAFAAGFGAAAAVAAFCCGAPIDTSVDALWIAGACGLRAARSPCELTAAIGAPHSPQNTTGPSHSLPHEGHLVLGPLTRAASPRRAGRRSSFRQT
jgi:hypothetical protein